MVGTIVREILSTDITISNGVIKDYGRKCVVLFNTTSNSALRSVRVLTRGATGLEIFYSRGSGVGGSVLSVGNRTLIVSRFALYTSIGGKGEPSFVNTVGPRLTDRCCSVCYRGLGRLKIEGIRGKVFNTSVGIDLMGSKPIAVVFSARV